MTFCALEGKLSLDGRLGANGSLRAVLTELHSQSSQRGLAGR